MPYKSDAQRRFFHSGKSGVSKEKIAEYDEESKGKKLPERVGKKKIRSIQDLRDAIKK